MALRAFIRAVPVFIAFAMAAGCVSSKEYKARLSDIDSLKAEVGGLKEAVKQKEAENAALAGEVDTLKKERDSLTEANRKLAAENSDLRFTMASSELEVAKNMGELRSALASKELELKDRDKRLAELEAERLKALEERDRTLSEIKATYDDLVGGLKEEIDKGRIEVTRLKDRLSVSMVEKILFDSGSAQIKEDGKKVLNTVAEVLKRTTGRRIRVEGHTDNVPIGPKIIHLFPTNWELSTTRATNVVRYLQDVGGVNPELLSAAGYSQYAPVASNDTAEGKAKNRRIEIVLIPVEAP